MGFLVIVMVFGLYVGMQQALFVPIDDNIPYYCKEGQLSITDFIYRAIRVCACISIFFTLKGGFLIGVGLYALAWLIKKKALYFTYER